jgi:predicted metal-dependent hydrolase
MNSYPQDQVVVVRRPVKHVRLRVREDCLVEAIVPVKFEDARLEAILNAKAKWIEQARTFFKTHPAMLTDDRTTITLFGELFDVIFDSTLREASVVDVSRKVIRVSSALHEQPARLKWHRAFAREFLRQRTKDLAVANGLSFNRIYVMNQKTVWGNCSKRQNISLNWQLIRAPHFVIDYVILHELLHTRFMSHGQAFWRSMSRLCERCQDAIAWLHTNRPKECTSAQAD